MVYLLSGNIFISPEVKKFTVIINLELSENLNSYIQYNGLNINRKASRNVNGIDQTLIFEGSGTTQALLIKIHGSDSIVSADAYWSSVVIVAEY